MFGKKKRRIAELERQVADHQEATWRRMEHETRRAVVMQDEVQRYIKAHRAAEAELTKLREVVRRASQLTYDEAIAKILFDALPTERFRIEYEGDIYWATVTLGDRL